MSFSFFSTLNSQPKNRDRNLFIVISGQSNAVGWNTGEPSESYLKTPIPNTYIWNGSDFEQLEYDVNNEGQNGHGIELNFGYLCEDYDTIYIVKNAVGSTSLANNWNKDTGNLYDGLIEEINNALSSINSVFESRIFYWNQGERDANDLEDANNYQTNLSDFIDDVRNDIISGNQFKFIGTRLSNNISRPYLSEVRTAQENVFTTKINCEIINQDDLSLQSDGIHFTSNSQNILALRTFLLI